jgi:hypothetical protein
MSEPLAEARAVLLRALDALDGAKEQLDGEPERIDLCVIYSAGRDSQDAWVEVGGWSSTAGPKWVHAALLRRAADAQDEANVAVDDEPGE